MALTMKGEKDLGNIYPGDRCGVCRHWLDTSDGRYNHQAFSDYLDSIGQSDYRVMDEGKTYTSKVYPWTIRRLLVAPELYECFLC